MIKYPRCKSFELSEWNYTANQIIKRGAIYGRNSQLKEYFQYFNGLDEENSGN